MNGRATAALGVIALGLLAGGGGCRQIVGVEERRPLPSTCSQTVHRDDACGECTERACCAEVETCKRDPVCDAFYVCLAACDPTDDACRSACRIGHPEGQTTALAALMACQSSACSEPCRYTCGGYVASSEACAACFARECCDSARACNATSGCLARRFCRQPCPDAECRTACSVSLPDGQGPDDALRSCQTNRCSTECAVWACVSRRALLSGPKSIALSLRFLDATQLTQPVAGLRIKRCNRTDPTCAFGSAEQTTDALGATTFEIPLTTSGFDGYFHVVDPAGAYVETLVLPWPVIVSDATLVLRAMTAASRADHARALGTTPLADRGAVLVHSRDCFRGEGAGVSYALSSGGDGETAAFYLKSGVAVRASQTDDRTDIAQAFGGFLNVVPGNTTLRGTALLSPPLEVFATAIFVKAGAITYVDHAPVR